MQQPDLWKKILDYTIDGTSETFGFTLRLASENNWTLNFAKEAILEYKKFMFLATTTNQMVSPSTIVDEVWHLHLIFTKSYQEFCTLLGKKIEHIPSTHNQNEQEKFKNAMVRTKELYNQNFGDQPALFWKGKDPLTSLHLKQNDTKKKDIIIIGITCILFGSILFFIIFRHLYIKLGNPYFIIGLLAAMGASIIYFEVFFTKQFSTFCKKLLQHNYLKSLNGYELSYLQTNSLEKAVHPVVNNLLKEGKIEVDGKCIKLIEPSFSSNVYENVVIEKLMLQEPDKNNHKKLLYKDLIREVKFSERFQHIKTTVDTIKDYIINSKQYKRLLINAYLIWTLIFCLAASRAITGISRGKPVDFIIPLLILYGLYFFKRLRFLDKKIFSTYIPAEYKQNLVTTELQHNAEWLFLFLGSSLFVTPFIPLTEEINSNLGKGGFFSQMYFDSDEGGCFTDGGSSCGSSCGGGCGGCGGD